MWINNFYYDFELFNANSKAIINCVNFKTYFIYKTKMLK